MLTADVSIDIAQAILSDACQAACLFRSQRSDRLALDQLMSYCEAIPMKDTIPITRRGALKLAGAGAGLVCAQNLLAEDPAKINANIKQSVCRWCYGKIPLEMLAGEAARLGYKSIELLAPDEYEIIKPLGLTCAMVRCASIADGLNRIENHDKIEAELRTNIEFAAAEKIPNVICMSGNRRGMSDEEGLENCAIGLKRVLTLAEEKKVTICMEGLNSKVNHKDYMYDKTAWGVALCQKLGSPRFKLLYDIYHMQIMEGDVIATIRASQGAHRPLSHRRRARPARDRRDAGAELPRHRQGHPRHRLPGFPGSGVHSCP